MIVCDWIGLVHMHGVNRAPQPVPEVKIQYNCSIASWDIQHKKA